MSECQTKAFTTFTLSFTLSLDMLNNFCFRVYAQKRLFIAENCNAFFGPPQQQKNHIL